MGGVLQSDACITFDTDTTVAEILVCGRRRGLLVGAVACFWATAFSEKPQIRACWEAASGAGGRCAWLAVKAWSWFKKNSRR